MLTICVIGINDCVLHYYVICQLCMCVRAHADSDVEQVWDVMTASERSEFQLMARSGLLSSQLHPRPPWWEVIRIV